MSNSNEAKRDKIGNWFAGSFQWRIPVYQRHYAWVADRKSESGPIDLLWDTIKRQAEERLEGGHPNQHYLGAVLVDHKSEKGAALEGVTVYDVVDGQQRLTTIQVALLALIKVANDLGCGSEMKESLKKYMFRANDQSPKLEPTNFDREQFNTVLYSAYRMIMLSSRENVSQDNAEKSKILVNFEFFVEKLEKFAKDHEKGTEKVINAIKDTLIEGFDIVVIILNETDDAQRVFESLNSNAKPLTTFDLIRNNIFYRAKERDEEIFNSPAWQYLESPYWEKNATNQKGSSISHIEAYIARLLISNQPSHFRFNRSEIFDAYRQFSNKLSLPIDREVEELSRYTKVYQYLDGREGVRNPICPEFDFGVFSYQIWSNRDFYPVIFSIVGSDVSDEEKQRMIKLLESYVIRRSVSSKIEGVAPLSSEHYNKHAVTLCRALRDSPNYKTFSDAIKKEAADTTVFPDDDRVKGDCVTTNFYRSVFKSYVFERIENSLHDVDVEKVVVAKGQLTIDHILPQKWDKNEQWKDIVLGAGENRNDSVHPVVAVYVHTIGNLTLMSGKNNTHKSNRPLDDCRELFAGSSVKLNRDLEDKDLWNFTESWNVEKIANRSKWLGEKICEIWPYDIE